MKHPPSRPLTLVTRLRRPQSASLLAFASLLTLAACSASATSASPDSGAPGGSSFEAGADAANGGSGTADGVTLTVGSAVQVGSVGHIAPTAGDIYVAVGVTLANAGTTTLPLLTPLFAATTASGVQYAASALTGTYAGGCDPSASLPAGSHISCTLLFESPASDPLNEVLYTLPTGGGSVSAPVGSVTTCTVCSGTCVDVTSDPENCGSCGNVAMNGCVNGVPTCMTSETVCDNKCVTESIYSCGPCGSQTECPSGAQYCAQQHCAVNTSSSTVTSCAAVCGAAGCYGASVTYGSQSHPECDESPPAITCSQTPAASINGCPFYGLYCDCGI